MKRISQFFTDRLSLPPFIRDWLREPQPENVGWFHSLGSILLFLTVMQFLTGSFLMLFYAPTPDDAWESLKFLTENFFSGKLLRSLHVWGTTMMVVAATFHILRVVIHGAYKRPREISWMTGVLLFLLLFGFAFTGYLLPWDQKAYWATQVGAEMMERAPVLGPFLARTARGGEELGAYTLTRFYAVHVVFLPGLFIAFVLLHLYLLRKHKIAPHPIPSKRTGKTFPFYPFQFFRDSTLTLLTFLILLGLAFFLPAGLAPRADPSDTAYDPRPEWYFLAHYELLRLFQGMEIIPTVIVPTAIILLLFALPFLDGSEHRDWRKRKPAAGVLLFLFVLLYGAALYSKVYHPPLQVKARPPTAQKDLPLPIGGNRELVLRGRRVFQLMKCVNCHELGGMGGLVGPKLDDVGRRLPPERIREQILNPEKFDRKTQMPAFHDKTSEEDLDAVVEYLSHFK